MFNFSLKKIYFHIVIFISFLIFNTVNANQEIKIVKKIDSEIITNIDVAREYSYLIALNNELKNLNKEEAFKIAENSLIREKIKSNEIKKFFKIDNFNNENLNENLIDKIIKNFFEKLGFSDVNNFELYLKDFDISIAEVTEKIKIEILWNQLIGTKFKNQININIDELKKKVKNEKLKNNNLIEYDLSEIVFQASAQAELETKVDKIISSIEADGFSTTANKFSVSSTSQFGGKIGKVKENQLSIIIKSELEKIDEGQYTNPIKVANGFLILLINNKVIVESELNEEEILNKMIEFETNEQFERFSLIYYNKLKLNTLINE